mgnify:CR=1 FL=1
MASRMESDKGRLELWLPGLVMVGLAFGGLTIGGESPTEPTGDTDEVHRADERVEPPGKQTTQVESPQEVEEKPTPSTSADVASDREYVPKSQRLPKLPPGAVPIHLRDEPNLADFLREEPLDDAALEAAFGGLGSPSDAGSPESPQP